MIPVYILTYMHVPPTSHLPLPPPTSPSHPTFTSPGMSVVSPLLLSSMLFQFACWCYNLVSDRMYRMTDAYDIDITVDMSLET